MVVEPRKELLVSESSLLTQRIQMATDGLQVAVGMPLFGMDLGYPGHQVDLRGLQSLETVFVGVKLA